MKRRVLQLFPQIVISSAGLFIMSLGVAFSVRADLGVSPLSAIPYVLSLTSCGSLGMLTIFFNGLLILFQILLNKKLISYFQLIQPVIVIVFGVCIDISLYLTGSLSVSMYGNRIFLCLLSCCLIGFGISLVVLAKVGCMPGEGLVMAIIAAFSGDFGNTKILVDTTFVLIAVGISFVLFGEIRGIREGTIVSAFMIGAIVRYFLAALKRLKGCVLLWESRRCVKEQSK